MAAAVGSRGRTCADKRTPHVGAKVGGALLPPRARRQHLDQRAALHAADQRQAAARQGEPVVGHARIEVVRRTPQRRRRADGATGAPLRHLCSAASAPPTVSADRLARRRPSRPASGGRPAEAARRRRPADASSSQHASQHDHAGGTTRSSSAGSSDAAPAGRRAAPSATPAADTPAQAAGQHHDGPRDARAPTAAPAPRTDQRRKHRRRGDRHRQSASTTPRQSARARRRGGRPSCPARKTSAGRTAGATVASADARCGVRT